MSTEQLKGKIVTCIKNTHPIYDDSFKSNGIRIGKSYRCVDELTLTAECYYIPEFASLKGVAIKNKLHKYWWSKPCLPKECFRLSTKKESIRYKFISALKAPFLFIKFWFFKILNRIDHIVRRKYYEKLYEDFI